MQKQSERIKEHLLRFGSIDALTAWREHGVYRLGAAIYLLRKSGMNITTKRKKVKNKYGESCSVGNYIYHSNQD